ncbi:MAG TPA: helix-hairpin-helix domain-containing protein [Emticicia sp.]
MKEHVKALFVHSKKELNGLLVFCILLVLIILLPDFCRWLQPEEVYNFDPFKKEIAAFRAQMNGDQRFTRVRKKEVGRAPDYFAFDPNNLDVDEWKRLGLSESQIRVIKNYESKGGRFYHKEDVRKIYSISAAEYQKLEPFIKIPHVKRSAIDSSHRFNRNFIRNPRQVIVVEVNSADSALLETLKGIGPAFASRIIKYRNRLGGFYNKLQLREVYGIDSVKYEELKDQVQVDASLIRKININTADFDALKRHPYLRYSQINAIIQYRKQHGNYNSINDVKKINIINEENFRKIEPYLNL